MKKTTMVLPALLAVVVLLSFNYGRQQTNPWRDDQLIQPAALAAVINDASAKQPVLFSIGFGGGIKNSLIEGPVSDSSNLAKWKSELQKLPRDADIVIYCGCCPFEHCPNIRPAFKLLNDMGFTHQRLLNLSHNIKADWIDKGYPAENKQ